ncbi:MAG: hypothetical protein R2741_12775 [Methanolobus sp.]
MKECNSDHGKLRSLVVSSEELFQSSAGQIDYQKITDNLLEISDAKYAAFVKYEEKSNSYFITALSGSSKNFEKAYSILGFNLLEKEWQIEPVLEKRLKNSNITHFPAIHKLTEGVFPVKPIYLLEKAFDVGETVAANIFRDNTNIGYFILIMPAGTSFKDDELIEIYTRQVGLTLERKKAEDKLELQFRFQKMISEVSSGFLSASDDKLDYVLNKALEKCGKFFNTERTYTCFFRRWKINGNNPRMV